MAWRSLQIIKDQIQILRVGHRLLCNSVQQFILSSQGDSIRVWTRDRSSLFTLSSLISVSANDHSSSHVLSTCSICCLACRDLQKWSAPGSSTSTPCHELPFPSTL